MRSCHSVSTDQFIILERFLCEPRANQGNMSGNTRGYIGFSAPGEGKTHDIVLVRREEGGRWNCKFCKIADGKHGDIMGIYRKKGFIKGEALRLLRTNSVRENFEQSKRDLERGYPLMPVQKTLTEVKFTDRNDALRNKTKQTKFFTVCYYAQYLQSSHTQSKKKIEKIFELAVGN